jgi:hypothetical protein
MQESLDRWIDGRERGSKAQGRRERGKAVEGEADRSRWGNVKDRSQIRDGEAPGDKPREQIHPRGDSILWGSSRNSLSI